MDYFRKGVEILNPGLTTFPLSAKTSAGMDVWADWLVAKVKSWKSNLVSI
jgi:hydrogenase nickel incorporation protein HypB